MCTLPLPHDLAWLCSHGFSTVSDLKRDNIIETSLVFCGESLLCLSVTARYHSCEKSRELLVGPRMAVV